MDSLDLSSSPSMAATREGDSSAEDVGVLSAVASLRKDAAALYQLRKYAECVDVLNQLLQKKEDDPKLFLFMLSRKSMKILLMDLERRCMRPLGLAIGFFYLHVYPKALSVLEPLFQNIEPMDEGTALHVCLLAAGCCSCYSECTQICLIIVGLARHLWMCFSVFEDVINYLEKAFGVSYVINQVDNGSMGQQQLSNLVSKSSSDSLSQTLSDETIEYETLLSTLDTGGHSLSRLSNLSSVIDLSRNPADRHSTAIDLKLKLPLYKLQLLLLTRSLKAAKREVKLAVNVARGRDSSKALLLMSQLEYARRNYPKAMKLLVASINEPEVGSSIILNNNYRCIYYQRQKHHTSSIFFHKALSNCLSHWKEKPSLSHDKSLLIMYNCGLQYLSLGRPTLSARCFEKADVVFYNRLLLWLRLAECCLMALERGLLKSSATLPHRSEFKVHVIGQGKCRHLSTDSGFLRNGHVRDDPHEAIDCDPKLSMLFALQCLFNALHLLACSEFKSVNSGLPSRSAPLGDKLSSLNLNSGVNGSDSEARSKEMSLGQVNSNGDVKEQRGGKSINAAAACSFPDYVDICRRENQMIKQAALVDLAFVELELGNPLQALSTARMFQNACLSRAWPKEAAEHMLIYLSSGHDMELPYTEDDCQQWQMKATIDAEEPNPGSMITSKSAPEEPQDVVFANPDEARGALHVNLAAVFVMQGDIERAEQHARWALLTMPKSRAAVLISVYLDLKRGNCNEAISKLRRRSGVSFLPRDRNQKTAVANLFFFFKFLGYILRVAVVHISAQAGCPSSEKKDCNI
ncbi:hypothetical protein Nepgr_022402 [Nepenthes gracilis]|uniref:CCR4-NOT transcription complex subunit 10 n=1 Tax=Nepenthes gracilis TaxID=150966 RepID=A0AAD3T0R8_NEPGR|nr:hypothetical protein Nepgr_022402 [Nepenthes gracilis]